MDIPLNAPAGSAGTHALVIGVSRYPDSTEFDDLTSAARSAAEVAAWLMHEYRNPDAPLASLHLLLSPAADEVLPDAVTAVLGQGAPATRAAVEQDLRAFRKLCEGHPDDVVFVYVAGHGVQLTKLGAIVLLEDFGADDQDSPLDGAIDMTQCHANFNGGDFPAQQVWFVDACRQRPELASRFETLSASLPKVVEPIGQVRSSPLFLAASSRELAFASVGGQTLFSSALLAALRGDAAVGPDDDCENWHVSVTELERRLGPAVLKLANDNGVDQWVDVTGRVNPAIVHRLAQAPNVEVQVNLVPYEAVAGSVGSLFYDGQHLTVGPVSAWPLAAVVPAGLYTLRVDVAAPYQPIAGKPLDVAPPSTRVFRVGVS
jgi:hypothetical protein